MIEPKRKKPVPWQPNAFLIGLRSPRAPETAPEHFLVNSARQVILRAWVSSLHEVRKIKD